MAASELSIQKHSKARWTFAVNTFKLNWFTIALWLIMEKGSSVASAPPSSSQYSSCTTPKMYLSSAICIQLLCRHSMNSPMHCTDWYHLDRGSRGLLLLMLANGCAHLKKSATRLGRCQSQGLLIVQWDRVWHMYALRIHIHTHSRGQAQGWEKGMRMTTTATVMRRQISCKSQLHNIYMILQINR